ncbi:hypothetical protein THAOC_15409 [Thalassiosira oceanica]|uniref:Uncharacterized protein n=1 Tax=Thalassiosira oceanica TaxID=159749 RepID=K0T0A1_THAOC|nr:hypothetical protein THAOC_15409 [Thalassiosira oceanica]|eukprot:EJK63907.1 hypothetical protein THAOC_15409 [Thalassiosira oceanica]
MTRPPQTAVAVWQPSGGGVAQEPAVEVHPALAAAPGAAVPVAREVGPESGRRGVVVPPGGALGQGAQSSAGHRRAGHVLGREVGGARDDELVVEAGEAGVVIDSAAHRLGRSRAVTCRGPHQQTGAVSTQGPCLGPGPTGTLNTINNRNMTSPASPMLKVGAGAPAKTQRDKARKTGPSDDGQYWPEVHHGGSGGVYSRPESTADSDSGIRQGRRSRDD